MKRRTLVVTVTAVAVLGATVLPAAAAWNSTGGGPGAARSGRLSAPTSASGTATSAGAHLTWAAPGTGPAPGGYLVTRNGATVCTTTATSCDEGNLTPGTTYTYLVSSTAGRYWVTATSLPVTATTQAGAFTISSVTPSPVTAGVGLTFSVFATYGSGTVDSAYNGPHPLTITSSVPAPGGKASGGQVTPLFAAGLTTKVATALYGSGAQTLTVSDGFRTGSVAITVNAAAPSTLELVGATSTAVVCGPGGHVTLAPGQQLTARVAVVDAYGNLAAASSALTVSLSFPITTALNKTSVSVPLSGSTSTSSFTLTMPTGTTKSGTLSLTAPGLSGSCSVN